MRSLPNLALAVGLLAAGTGGRLFATIEGTTKVVFENGFDREVTVSFHADHQHDPVFRFLEVTHDHSGARLFRGDGTALSRSGPGQFRIGPRGRVAFCMDFSQFPYGLTHLTSVFHFTASLGADGLRQDYAYFANRRVQGPGADYCLSGDIATWPAFHPVWRCPDAAQGENREAPVPFFSARWGDAPLWRMPEPTAPLRARNRSAKARPQAPADLAAAAFRNPFEHPAEVRFSFESFPPQILVVRDGDTGRPIQGRFEDDFGSFRLLPGKSVTFSCLFDELGEFAVDATCTAHFQVAEGAGERRTRYYAYFGNRHYAKAEGTAADRGWIESVTSETKDKAWAAPVHIGAVKSAPDFIFLNRDAYFGPAGAVAEPKGQAEAPARVARERIKVPTPMAPAPASAAGTPAAAQGPVESFEETKARAARRMNQIAAQYHRWLDQDLLPSGGSGAAPGLHPYGPGAGASPGRTLPRQRRKAPGTAAAPATASARTRSGASGPASGGRPAPAPPARTPGGPKTFGNSRRPLPAPPAPVSPITSKPLVPAGRFVPRLETIESGKKLCPAQLERKS